MNEKPKLDFHEGKLMKKPLDSLIFFLVVLLRPELTSTQQVGPAEDHYWEALVRVSFISSDHREKSPVKYLTAMTEMPAKDLHILQTPEYWQVVSGLLCLLNVKKTGKVCKQTE